MKYVVFWLVFLFLAFFVVPITFFTTVAKNEPGVKDINVKVFFTDTNKTVDMKLEDYILCVLMAI